MSAGAGASLHVHEWGDPGGRPVVCLHGVTGHGARGFERLAGALGGRRVISLDLRGHGRSPGDPPWDTETHAVDALATAAELGIERTDWIGFSFGGRVAAALATAAPERVERLCLLEPALHVDTAICLERAGLELEDESYGSPQEAADAELASGRFLRASRELVLEDAREHLERGPDGRLRWRYSPLAAIAAWSEMAREPPPVAEVPTLLVRGEGSWLGIDVSRYPRAEHGSVPGGHSLLLDAPDETAALVAAFLG